MAILRVLNTLLLKFFPAGLVFLLLIAAGDWLPAQNVTFNDVIGYGAALDDQTTGVELDANGDFYVTGYFSGTIDLDPGPGTFTFTTNTGGPDNYLAKFKSDGTLDWAWRQTSYDTDDRIRDIEIDTNGDVVVTGSFRQTVDFDPGPGTFNLTANGGSGGGTDIFIAKYSSGGSLIFAKRIGGDLNDQARKIVLNKLGEIFVCGYFKDSVDFDPGSQTHLLFSVEAEDAFILKLGASGNFQWVKQIGGLGADVATFVDLGIGGKILVGGVFYGTIDIDPSSQIQFLNAVGQGDCFVASYDPEGSLDWGFSLGSTEYESFNQGFFDREGKVVVVGNIRGTLDFDPGPDTYPLTTQSFSSTFMSRYHPNGDFDNAFLLSDQGNVDVNDVAEDEFGNINLIGVFSNTIDLDPGPGTAMITAAGRDIFFAKYDLKGSFRWAYGIRGDGTDRAGGIDVSSSGEVILTGATEERTDFNIGPGTDTIPWNGYLSAFVARYDQCIADYPDSQAICPDQSYTLGNQTLTTAGNYVETVSLSSGCDSIVTLNLSIVPVDTGITLQGTALVSSAVGASYQWIDCGSNQAIAGSTSPTFSPTYPGDFAVVVTENGCSDTSACLTVTMVDRVDPTDQRLVRLYPNPVKDVLHLEFPTPVKLSSIRVFDLTGRIVVSEQAFGANASYLIKLPDVPSGMYLVAVAFADGKNQVGRILVE